MAVVDVLNRKGEKVSQVDLDESLFNVPVKKSVLHEVVTMQQANRRSGCAKVKHRSEVSGCSRKLYRQKGTGRARRGNIKSPLLRGGGVIFGPDGRTYAYKVPKKVRRLALKMALSSKLQAENLLVLDRFDLERAKTVEFIEVLSALNLKNVLIVSDMEDPHLELSARNVPNVKVLRAEGLNVYDILKYHSLILVEPAIKHIEGRLLA